jgi:hypothetical protein
LKTVVTGSRCCSSLASCINRPNISAISANMHGMFRYLILRTRFWRNVYCAISGKAERQLTWKTPLHGIWTIPTIESPICLITVQGSRNGRTECQWPIVKQAKDRPFCCRSRWTFPAKNSWLPQGCCRCSGTCLLQLREVHALRSTSFQASHSTKHRCRMTLPHQHIVVSNSEHDPA